MGTFVTGVFLLGCEAPSTPGVTQHGEFYPVAVWYEVAGHIPEAEDQARAALTADFVHIRSLGFNTILAEGVEDRYSELLLDVAQEQSLRVILPHARTMAYIRGGQFDPEVMNEPETVVRENVRWTSRHPALLMHFIYDAPTSDLAERLGEVARLYRKIDPDHPVLAVLSHDVATLVKQADLPIVLWDNFPLAEGGQAGELLNRRYEEPRSHLEALARIRAQTPDRQHWVMIQALAMPGRLRFPTPAEWDVIYLSAVAVGFVDGVVFYRYHTDDQPDGGLAGRDHAVPPERAAAIKRMTERAVRWGRLLRGTEPLADLVQTETNRLRASLLVGTKRRLLLVYNPDVQTFAYDTVHLPLMVRDGAVARVVDVDESQRYLPAASGREITMALRLRPGEGRLFEVFAP